MTRLAAIWRTLRSTIRNSLPGFSTSQWTSLALIGALLSPITIPVRVVMASTTQLSAGTEMTTAVPNAVAPPAFLSEAERVAQVAHLDLNVRREVVMTVGQSLLMAGVPINAQGNAVNGLMVEWRSSDSRVVSITDKGEAIAQQSGVARLIASTGEIKETVEVTVSAQVEPSSAQSKEASTVTAPTGRKGLAEQDQPQSSNENRSLKNHRSALKAKPVAPLMPTPQPSPPSGDGLPPEQTNSLYAAYNIVGKPPARTEHGADTPPASIEGEENPGSSNFSFSVPVTSLPGRGISISLALTYNSRMWNKWQLQGDVNKYLTYDVDGGWPAPGFNLGYGHLDWQGSSSYGYTLVDPDGTRHQLLKPTTTSAYYESTDGTFIRVIVTSNVPTVTYTDGTQVLYSQANNAGRSFPVRVTERNGNFIEVSYRNGHGPELFTVKDTLGRYTRFYYDETDTTYGSKLIAVTVPKYGTSASTPDEQQTIRLYYTTVSVGAPGAFAQPAYGNASNALFRVLSDVYFPGTGSSYHYEYSTVYGMIRKITERRGITVSTMATDQQGTVTSQGQQAASTEYNYPNQASGLTDAPTYTRRTDDWAGRTTGMPGTGEAPYYIFQVVETPVTTDASLRYSKVTAPDGTISNTVSTVQPGQWYDGVVTSNFIETPGGTRLSQVDYDWLPPSANLPAKLNYVKITNEAGQVKKTVFSSYDAYNNPGVVCELGFSTVQGDGPELRRTETTYETGQGWIDLRLVHLPKSVKVYKGGTNELASQVDYEYDATTLASLSGSDPGMYANSGDNRGNLTSVTAYVDTRQTGTNGGTLTNTMRYDVLGNVVEETANCCRRKTFTYGPGYQYAYPTTDTRGDAGQLTTSAVYDFNTGAIISARDENNQQTTLQYDAATLRNTIVARPDGGYTAVVYHDGLYPDGTTEERHSYITTTTKLDASHEVTSLQYFDGRGATVRTFGADTPSGREATVDVEYDVMGRAYRSSNPYYAPSGAVTAINPTGLWTTSEFDQLGRVKSTRTPSGEASNIFSETSFDYAGTQTTITDAVGKKRRQIVDALGRLVRVDEPDASGNLDTANGPAQPTLYEYDVLNNLTHVMQQQAGTNGATQDRYFRYDALSRLTHERQVEQAAPYATSDSGALNNQWSSHVEYNVQGKAEYSYDARGIRTHLAYDGLNRVLEVSYTKQDAGQWVAEGTPTVTYTYDTDHQGYSNKDRLTQVKTAAVGSVPDTIQNYDYDLMGRVKDHYQKIGTTTDPYSMHYEYNLADELVSETYPSGRVVATGYDTVGRLSSLTDSINQQPSRTLVNGFVYAGHGGLLSETLGNGAVQQMSYNNGLQLKEISLTKNSELLQRYEYKYGQINMATGAVDDTKNNGQVARIEGFIGGTLQTPTKQWQQRLSYDSIGRLSQAAEYRGDSGVLTYQSNYQYDRFGNRLQPQTLNTQNLAFTPVEDTDIDKLTNRFKSMTNIAYDNAGNITSDGKFRGLRYEYDANGRQKSSTPLTQGLWQETAVYDGLGQRVRVLSDGAAENLIYDAFGRMIAEYGGQTSGAGGLEYVMMDHQGSTRVVMNGAGSVMARHDYQPFGEEVGMNVGMRSGEQRYSFTDGTKERYAGMAQDSASGLDHTWWRKYESSAGRWTSPDLYNGSMNPGDSQSFNRYSYVSNDPVNLVDPSGLLQNPDYMCYFYGLCNSGGSGANVGWSGVSAGFWGWGDLNNRPHPRDWALEDKPLSQRCPPGHICFVVPWSDKRFLPVDFGLADPFLGFLPQEDPPRKIGTLAQEAIDGRKKAFDDCVHDELKPQMDKLKEIMYSNLTMTLMAAAGFGLAGSLVGKGGSSSPKYIGRILGSAAVVPALYSWRRELMNFDRDEFTPARNAAIQKCKKRVGL